MSLGLVLFFTRGVSLRTWDMMGMLDREIALYKRLLTSGIRVAFITYGDDGDLKYSDRLGGIEICCNHKKLALEDYEKAVNHQHADVLSRADIFKTNQIYGGELVLELARQFDKKLIARCGYMWSSNAAKEHGFDSEAASFARRVEAKVFSGADRIIVTTDAMREDLADRLPHILRKVEVVPNYVDTDVFAPNGLKRKVASLLFVGRIAPEKNLASLLSAITNLPVELTLIGEGRLRPKLQEEYVKISDKINWEGNVPNSVLPSHMNAATAFVLPSFYEGHPKALIEAMSCGCPVIGADSPGINGIIKDRVNGLLCPANAMGFSHAIQLLLDNPGLRNKLGSAARDYVVSKFALNRISNQEFTILKGVANS